MITQQNSTHKAVKEGRKITIYIKGIDFDGLIIEDEPLYSIPAENEDDLFEIFERLDEQNRINVAEFKSDAA